MENKKEEIKEFYFSPSSIITLKQCPRRWWNKYVEGKKESTTIHLIKGNAVHNTLDGLFTNTKYLDKSYKSKLKKYCEKELNNYLLDINLLPISDIEKERHINDCKNMVNSFILKFIEQIDNLVSSGKAENETHAYHLLKPKLNEHDLIDKKLKIRGRIDSIQEDYDGNITIVDYKTSNKYKNSLTDDYRLQLSIYAYLYYINIGKLPNRLCINYLRFLESFYMEVDYDTILYAIDEIEKSWNFITKYTKKEEYYKKKTPLCESCTFKEECFPIEKKLKEVENNVKQQRLPIQINEEASEVAE